MPLATLKTSSLTSDFARQDVGPRDVVDVDEVHRLRAVAEDQRRLAGGDALHPADEHLGVGAVDVHARAVDVEVAQRRRTRSPYMSLKLRSSPSLNALAAP